MELNIKQLQKLEKISQKISTGDKLDVSEKRLYNKIFKDENKYILLKINKTDIIKKNNEKTGGFLPLIFAGLGALGALIGGASAVTNAVINKKSKDKQLEEQIRHNKIMEGKGIKKKSFNQL